MLCQNNQILYVKPIVTCLFLSDREPKQINQSNRLLAMLLEHVNKQNFIIHYKNLFYFFSLVIFCCDVGESALRSMDRVQSTSLKVKSWWKVLSLLA